MHARNHGKGLMLTLISSKRCHHLFPRIHHLLSSPLLQGTPCTSPPQEAGEKRGSKGSKGIPMVVRGVNRR